jgi:hypothetical protein
MRRCCSPQAAAAVTFLVAVSFGGLQAVQTAGLRVKAEKPLRRSVVIVAYYESEKSLSNVKYFIDYSLNASLVGVEYDIVVAEAREKSNKSPTNQTNHLYSRYRALLNAHFRWLIFDNVGFDFCLWKKAIRMIGRESYFFFAFMNGSVRGPFVRCEKSKKWLDEFTSRLEPSSAAGVLGIYAKTHPVKLVGTTVNCFLHGNIGKSKACRAKSWWFRDRSCRTQLNHLHVQSMFFVTDEAGVDLMNNTMSCLNTSNKWDVILKQEVGYSQRFLAGGWNIAALEEYWRGHNFQDFDSTLSKCVEIRNRTVHQDPYYPHSEPFRNGLRDVDPEEVIMLKYNRRPMKKKLKNKIQNLTDEAMECHYSIR